MRKVTQLDLNDIEYIKRKFETAAQDGPDTQFEYLARKLGDMFGLSNFEHELEEAEIRVNK